MTRLLQPTVRQLPPIKKLLAGALIAGAACVAVPSAASAASSCSYDATAKVMRVSDLSGNAKLRVVRSGDFLAISDGEAGSLTFCPGGGTFAGVKNTDQVLVSGFHNPVGDGYVVDMSQGELAPGFTPETDGKSEIEVNVITANPTPLLSVIGTGSADTIRLAGQNAVLLGNDRDVDINVRKPAPVGGVQPVFFAVNGGAGADFITGRGLFPDPLFGPAATRGASIEGGSGPDTLVDGLATDTLRGGSGSDTLFSADNGVKDFLFGGTESDTATVDSVDFRQEIESTTIGRLKLMPGITAAKAGKVVHMEMRWTHPKAWKQLKSLDLRVVRDGKAIGAVEIQPSSGRVTADGATALVAGKVAHKGTTVVADLAVRLPKAVAGESLRVDVEATDARGHRQLEAGAGLIRVTR